MFGHRRFTPLSVLISLGLVTAACASQAQPTQAPESSTVKSSHTLTVEENMATLTPMPNDPIFNHIMEPVTKATNAVATANAMGTPEGLVQKDNFPEKILKSQRFIHENARFFFNMDGKGWQDDLGFDMDGTLVRNSSYPDEAFFVTAGHSFDLNHLKPDEERHLVPWSGPKRIDFTNIEFPEIVIDGVVFNRDQFGLDHLFVDPNTVGGVDRAVIAINKNNVPADVWDKWMNDAISTDDVSYSTDFGSQTYFGICNSESADGRLVVGENMTFIRNSGNFVAVGDYDTSWGCSGSGVGSRKIIDGTTADDKLMGINVGVYNVYVPSDTTVSQVYPFSSWTQTGFNTSMKKAAGDEGILYPVDVTVTPTP